MYNTGANQIMTNTGVINGSAKLQSNYPNTKLKIDTVSIIIAMCEGAHQMLSLGKVRKQTKILDARFL